ncbi:F0F1 ATP synthase subunit B [Tenacibaculum maritimum]|uniref:ATP synthase subunit b n=1 Tax=Tenacibaculum maritimum NCIMB 2154 TaxID=1349785 RepID=A0A2H1E5W0_9FLAO|nr:F0F1 ATP synthase subunit B [Tenacibaculum maritimum]MCD9562253.1 F0F1 ATP synthase subunit B [Tenacibaculum maritimum]MCD9564600.1 F0F1 ATP synthase subunit B [Tenacibaculum maritimum]MCD9578330.1 F0F1 ATP synthase subunit B [Tenacibaculum maritimum]MCD9581321.1 F0F1 ATP synthase subunit B [Tenacibaculum maritimum]MCD9584158.1 F0F1 ATP synthase subunit B [Tenacibaculum maritimum]
MNLLDDFSPGLFIMQAVILLILIFLMIKFAWKPIMAALTEREEGIQNALDQAENAKKEMQNLQADNDRLLKEARAERDAMMKEAREIKEKMISDAKEEAGVEASKMIESAKTAIQQEQQAAMAHLKKQVADLSIGIAETIVKKELASPTEQAKLVEGMLEEVTLN